MIFRTYFPDVTEVHGPSPLKAENANLFTVISISPVESTGETWVRVERVVAENLEIVRAWSHHLNVQMIVEGFYNPLWTQGKD